MMNLSLYVAWRLFAARQTASNLRIVAFVPSGLKIAGNDTPATQQLFNVFR